MDFSQHYSLDCNSTYTVSTVNYDGQGNLKLEVDYREDMEDRTCEMTLTFDPSYINSGQSSLSFLVDSSNIELLYS